MFITPYLVDGGFNHRATLTFQGGLIETHGADAFEQVPACTLGVGEFGIETIQVFPNPVGDVLHVTAKNPIDSVVIYNLLGQQLLRTVPNALIENINMSGFDTGMYLVKVAIGNQIQTYKVLKE